MATTTKRIIVGAADEPTLIAEKLIDTEADIVIFSIAKKARFSDSLSNFKLLKREAEVLGKEIVIESVDPRATELAEEAGLAYQSSGSPLKTIADIRPVSVRRGVKVAKRKKGTTVEVEAEVEELPVALTQTLSAPVEESQADAEDFKAATGEPVRPKRIHRRLGLPAFKHRRLIIIGTLIGLAAVLYVALAVLPRASATIVTKKEPWTFAKSLTVDTAVSTPDSATLKVPGQLFTARKTLVEKYQATGKRFIERKSQGTLTVYNAYSSAPQSLVASTRFVTPGGAVYRLVNSIIVPGARIQSGKIVASSITATVASDKAGPDHNSGPVPRLSIPGFSGSPKFQGFYGELKEGTTGGYIGEALVPTETDLRESKAKALSSIEATLRGQISSQVPDEFTIDKSPAKLAVTRQIVDGSTDPEGKFSISTEAELSVMAFREQDVLKLLSEKALAEKGAEYEISSYLLSYGTVKTELVNKSTALLPLNYTAQLARTLDKEALKEQMGGQSEEQLRATIFSLPGIDSAHIALWPFWVRSVPADPHKISLTVE